MYRAARKTFVKYVPAYVRILSSWSVLIIMGIKMDTRWGYDDFIFKTERLSTGRLVLSAPRACLCRESDCPACCMYACVLHCTHT
jgi:hypothetical protein